jgi:hypothetical protein
VSGVDCVSASCLLSLTRGPLLRLRHSSIALGLFFIFVWIDSASRASRYAASISSAWLCVDPAVGEVGIHGG